MPDREALNIAAEEAIVTVADILWAYRAYDEAREALALARQRRREAEKRVLQTVARFYRQEKREAMKGDTGHVREIPQNGRDGVPTA